MVKVKAPVAMIQLMNLPDQTNVPYVVDPILTSNGQYAHLLLWGRDAFNNDNQLVSAICQPGSYGFPDHIEVMIGDDEPEGYLTPEEACQIFVDQWRWINGE